jgi:hypothetical protein
MSRPIPYAACTGKYLTYNFMEVSGDMARRSRCASQPLGVVDREPKFAVRMGIGKRIDTLAFSGA